METITNKTKALIHVAKSELGLADTVYRDILHVRFGKESCKDLTPAQAKDLIKYFKSLGFRVKGQGSQKCNLCVPRHRREKPPENVFYLVSEEQLAKIEHLKQDIKWRVWDGYQRWLEKYFKIERVRLSIEASVVIEGLKGMWKSQNKCGKSICGMMGKIGS
jgi:transposase